MSLSDVSKRCKECGELKNLSDFYVHKQMADGHLNVCKPCYKIKVKANREANIDYYRAYDVKRGNRQDLSDLQRYRGENPKKYVAHTAVNNAVRDGKLIVGACEVCGSTKVHGHHDDYSKPLVVRWLCSVHHKEWHKANGEGLNA